MLTMKVKRNKTSLFRHEFQSLVTDSRILVRLTDFNIINSNQNLKIVINFIKLICNHHIKSSLNIQEEQTSNSIIPHQQGLLVTASARNYLFDTFKKTNFTHYQLNLPFIDEESVKEKIKEFNQEFEKLKEQKNYVEFILSSQPKYIVADAIELALRLDGSIGELRETEDPKKILDILLNAELSKLAKTFFCYLSLNDVTEKHFQYRLWLSLLFNICYPDIDSKNKEALIIFCGKIYDALFANEHDMLPSPPSSPLKQHKDTDQRKFEEELERALNETTPRSFSNL